MSEENAIKKPNVSESFTQEELDELEKCKNDPFYFIENYYKVTHNTRGVVLLELYEYQKEMLHAIHTNRSSIGLTARQMGKCVSYETMVKKNNDFVKLGNLVNLSFKQKIVNYLENILSRLS